ncbi:GspE/PulE family protein [Patescibacteria group bacterium]
MPGKQDKQYESFLDTLKTINRGTEERETQIKALTSEMSYVNLFGYPVDLQVLALFPKELAEETRAIAFFKKDTELRVGIVNPNNLAAKDKIEKIARKKKMKVIFSLISESSFLYGLNLYKKIGEETKVTEDIEVKIEDIGRFQEKIKSITDLEKILKTASTTEIVNTIFAGAIVGRASDIHLEPTEEKVKVRYRIDGILDDVAELNKKIYPTILSRIKFLAKMKLNIEDVPQDGKFSVRSLGRRFDIRVSSLPTPYGESLVMRLLDQQQRVLSLEELGMMGRALDEVEKAIKKTNGMILSCGPTGSGKTTTLYAFLGKLNTEERKIITIEDPIEYKLSGISQSQVDSEGDYTFANGLKSIVRQDPDIVMVGEIRDQETADIAVNAALTGHLMLSTLHTNDASGAIPRLIDMGIQPFLLASGLSVIIAQRLVRRVCEECVEELPVTNDQLNKIKTVIEKLPEEEKKAIDLSKIKTLRKGKGCSECNKTGYKGRVGLFEVLVVTKEMKKLIHEGGSGDVVKELALKEGMVTLEQDGVLKVLDGVTTLEEVERVTAE